MPQIETTDTIETVKPQQYQQKAKTLNPLYDQIAMIKKRNAIFGAGKIIQQQIHSYNQPKES